MFGDTRHAALGMVYARVRMRGVRMMFCPGDSELVMKRKIDVVRFRRTSQLVDILLSVFDGW